MAPAVATLSVHEGLTCRERGRAFDLAAAVEKALVVCESVSEGVAPGTDH
jgi:hypothetical protein